MNPIQPITWKEFFDRHAAHYDQNRFTFNTEVEVQFLMRVMGLEPGMALLDMGCGTGRHASKFAELGIKVTGVDVSPAMLSVAKKKSDAVEWIEADATSWARQGAFDAAICICEGGIGLINQGENPIAHDLAILNNISASLKSGAPFVLTAMNGYALIRRMSDENVEAGSFDPATMVAHYVDDLDLPEGKRPTVIYERLFIPPEMTSMLHHCGFETLSVWGGTAGDWGERPIKLDEIEAMFVCRRR